MREGRELRPAFFHSGQVPVRGTGAYFDRTARLQRRRPSTHQESVMSKGMDRKKEQKKKPAKTMKEKRAEKSEKKAGKAFAPA